VTDPEVLDEIQTVWLAWANREMEAQSALIRIARLLVLSGRPVVAVPEVQQAEPFVEPRSENERKAREYDIYRRSAGRRLTEADILNSRSSTQMSTPCSGKTRLFPDVE
jgi:hypothetical protein